MGSDCVIAFLDESDAEGLYPATEEDPLAGTDTQFRDGGDAATVTGSMYAKGVTRPVRPTETRMSSSSVMTSSGGYLKAIAHRGVREV